MGCDESAWLGKGYGVLKHEIESGDYIYNCVCERRGPFRELWWANEINIVVYIAGKGEELRPEYSFEK
jgi:hypothetical protein